MVCELHPCPGGLESVLVGDEAAAPPSGRALLPMAPTAQIKRINRRGRDQHQLVRHGGRLQHRIRRDGDGDGAFLRGQGRTRPSEHEEGVDEKMLQRQRRLADIRDVAFSVPTEPTQVAEFFNNLADPVSDRGEYVACPWR